MPSYYSRRARFWRWAKDVDWGWAAATTVMFLILVCVLIGIVTLLAGVYGHGPMAHWTFR